MSFSTRLKELIGETSILAFANKSGVPQNSIRQYLNGSIPGLDKVIAIADANNVSVEWLATGKGTKDDDSNSQFVAIPVLPTAGSSRGGLAIEFSEIGAAYPLPHVWAQRHKLKESNTFAIWGVEGMEPTCSSSDILIGTTATLGMSQNGVFIIKEGELFNVRRLQWKDGHILVKSDSGLYEDDTLPLDTDAIVARVMYVTRTDRFNDVPRVHSSPA